MIRKTLAALLAAFFVLSAAAQAEYLGSEPSGGVYVVQSASHTCTLVAATMMLRNYADRNGYGLESITQSDVRSAAWSGHGLSWDFTVHSINVQVVRELGSAEDRKAELIRFLRYHPEGVVIYDADAPHAVWLFGYDGDADVFYCADTTTSVAGRAIRLEECILPGETQEDKLAAIDRLWYVTGTKSSG